MKFLFSAGKGLEAQSIRLGWQNALKSLGYDCIVWNEEENIFDIMESLQPDFFVVFGKDLDRSHLKAIIKSNNSCKPIIFATHINDVEEKEKYLLEKFTEKKLITHLFSVDFQNHASLWEKNLDIPTLSCLPALDLVRYKRALPDKLYSTDIAFIGQYEYKKIPLACDFLFPLNRIGLQIKVFGYGDWPIPNYLGSISSYDIFSKITYNAKLNLSFSYPESKTFSERVFKTIGCFGLPLVHVLNKNHLTLLRELEVPTFVDSKELVSQSIFFYNQMQEQRNELAEKIHKNCINKSHTYLHRVEKVLSCFGINIKDEVYEKIGDSSK